MSDIEVSERRACECKIEACLIDATECDGSWHAYIPTGESYGGRHGPAHAGPSRLVHFKRCHVCIEELETLRAELGQKDLVLFEALKTRDELEALLRTQNEQLRAENARLEADVAYLQAARNELAQLNVSGVNLGELLAERWFTERLRKQVSALESRNKALLEACEGVVDLIEAWQQHFTEVHKIIWKGDPPSLTQLRAAISAAKEKA